MFLASQEKARYRKERHVSQAMRWWYLIYIQLNVHAVAFDSCPYLFCCLKVNGPYLLLLIAIIHNQIIFFLCIIIFGVKLHKIYFKCDIVFFFKMKAIQSTARGWHMVKLISARISRYLCSNHKFLHKYVIRKFHWLCLDCLKVLLDC